MDRLKKYLSARQTAVFILFSLILIIFSALVGYFFALNQVENISSDINKQMLGKCGAINELLKSENINGREESVAEIILSSSSLQDINQGEKIMKKYGYSTDMNYKLNGSYIFISKNWVPFFCIGIILPAITVTAVGILTMRSIFAQIRKAAMFAGKILDDPESCYKNTENGDIGSLFNAVSMLGSRMHKLLVSSRREKICLKEFISNISHQMKTPIASLKLNHELLFNEPDMPAQLRLEFIRRNINEIERLEWLVSGQLKLAKVDADMIQFNNVKNNLNLTTETVFSSFYELAVQKSISLINSVPLSTAFCYDKDWIAEAISNVVKNSLEHTPRGGKIEISANETPLTVMLSIKDNGRGISKEMLPHIFDRFYSAADTNDTNRVGIGLSLAYSIFSKSGGQVKASSTEGLGTEISVVFIR